MNKIATIVTHPAYCTFQVFNANVSIEETYHAVSDRILAQGFSARPGSLNFSTIADCSWITIEVWVAEPQEEINIRPDTIRAILLPFSVDKEGIVIADTSRATEESVLVPEGNYALLFELKLRDDVDYLNSLEYQQNVEGGRTEEWCRLTFYPREDAVQPEILRLDAWSAPPYEIEGYAPLNPTYPLLMDDRLDS